jgi:chromate transporter
MHSTPTKISEIAQVFFKLGILGFGGPAAHIAMMRKEVVEKRQWLSEKEFLDLLGATQLIPGPNSTELAIHVGHTKGGWKGLLVAGGAFIFPAFVCVLTLAYVYVRWGELPSVEPVLMGIRPVIMAIVADALFKLRKSALPDLKMILVALTSFLLAWAGINEVVLILGVSLAYAIGTMGWSSKNLLLLFSAPIIPSVAHPVSAVSGNGIFWFFIKIGSVLFGSGYVLLAFLQEELVANRMWLTEKQLLDAITVGQITPGPVFTTATFIGYLLKSYEGAILATLGIFLPSFFFVAVSAPFLPRMRNSKFFGHFLDAINAASLALLAKVTLDLGIKAIVDLPTILIGVVSFALILKFKNLNTVWPMLSAGVLGYFIFS